MQKILLVSRLFQISFKGHRLNSTVIKFTHANTGAECVMKCMLEDESCRSVNFLKDANCEKNCEFLRDISTDPNVLLPNDIYDYYILLSSNKVSVNSLMFFPKESVFQYLKISSISVMTVFQWLRISRC